jgi:hypothetical protein
LPQTTVKEEAVVIFFGGEKISPLFYLK